MSNQFPSNHYHSSSKDDQGHVRGVKLCLLGELCNRNDEAYTISGDHIEKEAINSVSGKYKQIIKIRPDDIIPIEARWVGIGQLDGDFFLFYEVPVEVENYEK